MGRMKYILYARKSTDSDDKQVQSIEAQVYEMQKIAKQLNLQVVTVLRESKSAKAPFKRPEFNKMIDMLKSGRADGILTWQLNRLSRNPAESGLLQQMLQDEVIQEIKTHDSVHRPNDNALIFSVETSISNQFIRDLRKNVRRGIAAKAKNGGISGPAPQGYVNNRIDKTIEKDPTRFNHVRKIFDMYLQGYRVPDIRRAMDDMGYLTPKSKRSGGKPLSSSTIYHILSNPRYAGVVPDPYDHSIHYTANHPAMITVQEYDRVQQLLGDKGRPRLCASRHFSLKGLIRCGECGCMITAQAKYKKLSNGLVNEYVYYHCTRKRPCSQRSSIREGKLMSMVEDLIDQYELSPELYKWGMEALDKLAKHEIKQRDEIQMLQFNKVQDIEKQLDRLLDMATRGLLSADRYEAKSKLLESELTRRQREQTESSERTKNWYEFVGRALDELTNMNNKFSEADIFEKSRILKAIGENPVLIDGNLSITPYGWLQPIKKELAARGVSGDMVRTSSQQIENDDCSVEKLKWYPGLELNQRPKA